MLKALIVSAIAAVAVGSAVIAGGRALLTPLTETQAAIQAARCLKIDPDVGQELANRLGFVHYDDGRPVTLNLPIASAAAIEVSRGGCTGMEHRVNQVISLATTKVARVTKRHGARYTSREGVVTFVDDRPPEVYIIALTEHRGGSYHFLVTQSVPPEPTTQ